jgi:hypothetical protein
MSPSRLRAFRDRFNIPISDDKIDEDSVLSSRRRTAPSSSTCTQRRRELGGYLPARRRDAKPLEVPELAAFERLLKGTAEREISTTMAFVRDPPGADRDKAIGKHVVPIVPDESRTFGMEGMFRQLGIYSSRGQLYTPEDRTRSMYYREDKDGQILQEGINEAGGMCVVDRRGDLVFDATRADGPVLHLLLDVRLPARRRPRLGGRRHARARLPARRHRRSDDAERRGPAARGRPLAHPGGHGARTASRTTRPTPTSSRSSSRTACGGCTRSRRTSTTTSR